jgi:hypothetical protein
MAQHRFGQRVLSGLVDVAAMPHSDDEYDEAIVVDIVDDAVVADSYSIRMVLTCESDASWGARLVGQ